MKKKGKSSVKIKLEPQDEAKVINETTTNQRSSRIKTKKEQKILLEVEIKQEEELIIKDETQVEEFIIEEVENNQKSKRCAQDSKTTICPVCNSSISSHKKLRIHMKNVHKAPLTFPGGYECKNCNGSFKTEAFLRLHLRRCSLTFSCDHCGISFNDLFRMRIHVKTHAIHKVKCKICFKEIRLSSVLFHMRSYHQKKEGENLTCQICSKTFANKSFLQDHIKRHDDKRPKPFKCLTCGYQTARKAYFENHLLTHKNSREMHLKCDKCNYKTDVEKNFLKHLKTHDRVLNCKICKKIYANQHSFDCHMKLHQNPEQFQCKTCGLKLTNQSNLNQHLKLHNKDRAKPFECSRSNCNYKAGRRIQLKQHQKSHDRTEKMLKEFPEARLCKICFRVLKTRKSYLEHLKLYHSGRPKFTCDICGSVVPYKGMLTTHFKKIHSMD